MHPGADSYPFGSSRVSVQIRRESRPAAHNQNSAVRQPFVHRRSSSHDGMSFAVECDQFPLGSGTGSAIEQSVDRSQRRSNAVRTDRMPSRGTPMSIRHLSPVVVAVIASSITASGQAPGPLSDAPRVLVYSAPLLKVARQASMDMDSAGRIYLAGYICEPTLPVTPGAAQPAYAGGCDGFVAILSPDHRLQYRDLSRGNRAGANLGHSRRQRG